MLWEEKTLEANQRNEQWIVQDPEGVQPSVLSKTCKDR